VNLGINPKKSFFGYLLVYLLGFLVDGFGLSTIEERTAAIAAIKMPETLDDLEHYIGMIGFLRRFVPFY
jgi:hypothetical protein